MTMSFEKPSKAGKLENRAKQHPDYEKFMKMAGHEDEAVHPEDAMAAEHRADASEERLYNEARLYWLRRGIGADAQGFSVFGEHRKKPEELAKAYKVDVHTAEQAVTDTNAEIEAWLAEQNKKGGFDKMKEEAEKEISRLEQELSQAA